MREAAGSGLLVEGASEVVTMAGGLRRGTTQGDPAALRASELGPLAVALFDGLVAAVGPAAEVRARLGAMGLDPDALGRLDARGGTVTPGLIDPHTHLLFAGTREGELRMRQDGADYLAILRAGGGILSTVRATRKASEEALEAHGRRWLREMLASGVTTVEAKSGYGLDVDTELRLLRVAGRLGTEGPVEVVPTWLGAHAVPPEHRDAADPPASYLGSLLRDQLPQVARQGIARFCDVFCERGVFEVQHAKRLLVAARETGMDLRLHADELRDSGGAALAAELGARSADHLAAIPDAGIEALGRAADDGRPVVATVLPATTFYLRKERVAPARALIDRGVPVAVGTDFNPGTSPTASLPLALSMACVTLGLSASEALAAATIQSAHAVGLGESHGALEAGRVGDLVVWDVATHELIPYWIGTRLARSVMKRGRVVVGD
jgi:imidazolonepropionase